MTQVINAMNGFWGRLVRAILGLALMTYGLAILGDISGFVMAGFGLVPLGLGLSGRCVLEPFAPTHPTTPEKPKVMRV